MRHRKVGPETAIEDTTGATNWGMPPGDTSYTPQLMICHGCGRTWGHHNGYHCQWGPREGFPEEGYHVNYGVNNEYYCGDAYS